MLLSHENSRPKTHGRHCRPIEFCSNIPISPPRSKFQLHTSQRLATTPHRPLPIKIQKTPSASNLLILAVQNWTIKIPSAVGRGRQCRFRIAPYALISVSSVVNCFRSALPVPSIPPLVPSPPASASTTCSTSRPQHQNFPHNRNYPQVLPRFSR